jgi:hypothetical protein
MKKFVWGFLIASGLSFGQDVAPTKTIAKKGSFFAYWGWNRSLYSTSDIHFSGNNYDFTLENVEAKDRQSPFSAKIYLNPGNITIPQYNFRLGYYLNEKYSISFGADHMKYVMVSGQMSTISGNIATSSTYDGTYAHDAFQIKPDFLLFEHTDGLNYLNLELRRMDKIYSYKNFKLNVTEGFGGGIVVPRTNTTLLNYKRYDQFHLAGFGLGAVFGLNFQFYERFFIQFEEKVGFINLPDIRTTMHVEDKASQHFNWLQGNVVLGVNFNYKKKQ